MKRLFKKVSLVLLVIIVLIEVLLRFAIGFGEVPIYVKSFEYEYIFAPNQEIQRFHNSIITNELSMRSKPLQQGETRIVKFGDSVLNGGVGTDHNDLASSILEDSVQAVFDDSRLRVLNVSAGSWGPDNAFAWLKEHPDLNPELIILLFGSQDWLDFMEFQDVVGNQPNYPDQQPALAITDAVYWFYTRYIQDFKWNNLEKVKMVDNSVYEHNPGWDKFINYTKDRQIELVVYHHPDRAENDNHAYNEKGQKLENYLRENGVADTSGLETGLEAADYHDSVHPKGEAQAKIAAAIQPHIFQWIKSK